MADAKDLFRSGRAALRVSGPTAKRMLEGGMRPLYHPPAEEITVEGLLHALSDPVRARIFAALVKSESPCICADFLQVDDRTLPKSTISQHFKILREAGLIRSERKGVEMRNTSRCAELEERFGGMISSILAAYYHTDPESSRSDP